MRLGLDLHGVIDDDPDFFSSMAYCLNKFGSEVYIVTGREETPELHHELKMCSFEGVYTRIYKGILSITGYQKTAGTKIIYLDAEETKPTMAPEIWNPTKAILCAAANIDLMIDDSPIYGTYFRNIKTQYLQYNPQVKEFLKTLLLKGRDIP